MKAVKGLFTRSFSGRVRFSKEYSRKILLMEDGKKFQVIRDLKVDPKKKLERSAAVFKVRFKFSGLPLFVNKRLSMFPVPFLIAKTGFCEKIWAINEEGYFQGIYQWESKDYAEEYPGSFIFKMMTKRSAAGTLFYEVIPNTLLSNYVKKLI